MSVHCNWKLQLAWFVHELACVGHRPNPLPLDRLALRWAEPSALRRCLKGWQAHTQYFWTMPLGSLRTRIEVALGRNGLAPGYVTYTDVSLHYQPPMMHWAIVPFKQGAWKGSYVGCVFIKTLWFNSDLAKMCIKSFKCLQILYLFTTFCWKQLSLLTCEQDFSYLLQSDTIIILWYRNSTVL